MKEDTGEFNRLHLRLGELEQDFSGLKERVSSLESEVLARVDGVESTVRSLEAQVKRQTANTMGLQVEVQALRKELMGWRDHHSQNLVDLHRQLDEHKADILAAIHLLRGT